jgi:hypothetical protein
MYFKIDGDTTHIYTVQEPKRRININSAQKFLLPHFVIVFLPDVPPVSIHAEYETVNMKEEEKDEAGKRHSLRD